MQKTICALILMGVAAWPQPAPVARPAFKDFAVEHVYNGAPVPPKLSSSQRTFRTMIRRGAESPVEFAGHYTVPRWGCGTACIDFVVVDSITGKAYDCFTVSELPMEWAQKHEAQERMEFHPNSRLIKINGCINEKDCGFYDYVMEEAKGLKLVPKELLPKQFQN
jgi:hypothetical protein